MKLIGERTIFIPGFCVFYIAPQRVRRASTTRPTETTYRPRAVTRKGSLDVNGAGRPNIRSGLGRTATQIMV